ncbi:hypothetical protein [Larkinella arboricola]
MKERDYTLLSMLTLLVLLVCLSVRLEAYQAHQTLSLPYWTALAFVGVLWLVFEPVITRLFKK